MLASCQQHPTHEHTALQVSLPVVRKFVKEIEEKALGTKVLKGVKPDQQLVKVVNDQLIELMGGKQQGLEMPRRGPQVQATSLKWFICIMTCLPSGITCVWRMACLAGCDSFKCGRIMACVTHEMGPNVSGQCLVGGSKGREKGCSALQ